jgi:integrase
MQCAPSSIAACGIVNDKHADDLRHMHATLPLKEGVNVKVVREQLGHANIGITLDTSAQVLPSMEQQAAEGIDAALFGVG